MIRPQATLAAPFSAEGVGLHSGQPCQIEARPAAPGSGLRFVRVDLPGAPEIAVDAANVRSSQLATTLASGSASVSTTEHLLAALYGLRIDNAILALRGPEVPALDGSSAPWAALARAAGRAEQPRPARRLRVLRRVEVRDGERMLALSPAEGLHLDVTIHFDHAAIGTQALKIELHPDAFVRELAWARTFGFSRDLDAMRLAGLSRGGSLDNAVLFAEGGRVLNPDGLRAPDEPVRHKTLDLVGDLALLGAELVARVEALRPGHALSLAAIQALLSDASAWTFDA